MNGRLPLRVVDARTLPESYRRLLAPEEPVIGRDGRVLHRPRYFYEVESWNTARDVQLTEHFGLWEFIDVDVREAAPLRGFPRYVPCSVGVLAVHLELFRLAVGAQVRIAANGGYRSPSHEGTDPASPHTWGTAVNIHRIGADDMTDRAVVERYAEIAHRALPAAWCRPFGPALGQTIDHLHIDLGYIVSAPRDGAMA